MRKITLQINQNILDDNFIFTIFDDDGKTTRLESRVLKPICVGLGLSLEQQRIDKMVVSLIDCFQQLAPLIARELYKNT